MEEEKKKELKAPKKKTQKTAAPKTRKQAVKKTPTTKNSKLESPPVEKTGTDKPEKPTPEKKFEAKPEEKPLEYESDALKVAIYRKPACRIEVQVKASVGLTKEAHKKAIHIVAKQVSFPGFRKGKVPDELVLKNYARDVEKNWQQALANLTFKESQKLAKIPLLDASEQVQFKMGKYSLEEGAELLLAFETTPEPPTIDPKTFQLKSIDTPTIDDEKVDEAIDQVRFYFAKWNPVTDRPVKEGDYLLLDVEDMEVTPPKKVYTDTRFEVSDKRMAQWMKKIVLGMQTDESKEGVSEPDKTASEEEKKEFQPKKVRLTIKAIQEVELPPIDDTLAKNLGVRSSDEIRSSVERLLQKQVDDYTQKQLREQANEFLIQDHPFDLPPSLVEKEARFRLDQLGIDPKFLQFWQGRSEDERKEIVKEIYDQADKAVRMFYLCRKVVSDAKISITVDDVAKPGSTPLEILLQPSPEAHFKEDTDIGHSEAYSRLIMQKAEDYIISHASKPTVSKKK